jgi:hypothetical protein
MFWANLTPFSLKLDEVHAMMYLIECRYQRDDEDQREPGHPIIPRTKVTTGTALILMFTAYIWGPMLIFSLVQSVSDTHTNNVAGASLSVDILMVGRPC